MCFRIKPEQIQIFYFHMDSMITHYGMFMGGITLSFQWHLSCYMPAMKQ